MNFVSIAMSDFCFINLLTNPIYEFHIFYFGHPILTFFHLQICTSPIGNYGSTWCDVWIIVGLGWDVKQVKQVLFHGSVLLWLLLSVIKFLWLSKRFCCFFLLSKMVTAMKISTRIWRLYSRNQLYQIHFDNQQATIDFILALSIAV